MLKNNMQKNIIFMVLLLVVIASGAVLSLKYPSNKMYINQSMINNSTASAAIKVPNQYKNEAYNFKLDYPFNLQLKESSSTAIIIGTINDLETNSEVEIKIVDTVIKNNATESAAVREAKQLCKSSMHNLDINCTKVINETSEVSLNGINLKSFYLEEVTTNKQNGQITTTQNKGPFITVPLSKTKSIETFILVYPSLENDPHLTNTQLIREVASSIQKLK